MSRLGAAIYLLAVAALLAACASRSAAPATSDRPGTPTHSSVASTPAPAQAPIVIDSDDGLIFRPSADVPARALSPEEAWSRYVRHSHGRKTRIPASVRVRYGRLSCAHCNLTDTHDRTPCGKSAGLFNWSCIQVRSYGYSLPNTGCLNTNPNFSPPPHLRCTEWTFVSAFTGRMIIGTWQQTNPPP